MSVNNSFELCSLELEHKIPNTYCCSYYTFLEMQETLPLISFLMNKYMSSSEIGSSSTFVILRIASQLKSGALIFQIHQLTIQQHSFSTSRDDLLLLSFQIFPKT